MATLGNTSTPDTNSSYYRPRVFAAYVGQMPSDGTLTNIHIYCDSSFGAGGPQDFSLGVYTANGSDYPDDFVVAVATAAGDPGWVSVSVSQSLTSGQHIWVSFVVDPVDGDNTFRIYGTSAGAAANIRQGAVASGTYPNHPTPWANDDTYTVNQPAVYITYTTSGGVSIPVIQNHRMRH